MFWKISVNAAEIANKVGESLEVVDKELKTRIQQLASSTHAYIAHKANTELSSHLLKEYLGPNGEYLQWDELADGIWVVSLDNRASWLEETGRPPTSMATSDWLLKPGKVKQAKDGSTYRSIPFSRNPKTKVGDLHGSEKVLQHMIHAEMKSQGISLNTPTLGKDKKPILGVVAKLDIPDPGLQFEGLHSAPRTPEQAALSGLKEHGGIFKLQNAVVTQRMVQKGKRSVVKKEVVVFRTVSSKHQAEGKWMYPEIKPAKFFEAGYEYATKELDIIIKDIHTKLGGI